jgi:hypothetical protein
MSTEQTRRMTPTMIRVLDEIANCYVEWGQSPRGDLLPPEGIRASTLSALERRGYIYWTLPNPAIYSTIEGDAVVWDDGCQLDEEE